MLGLFMAWRGFAEIRRKREGGGGAFLAGRTARREGGGNVLSHEVSNTVRQIHGDGAWCSCR